MAITLTPRAVEEIKRAITAQQKQEAAAPHGEPAADYVVRVGVVGGGCSGFNYDMSLTRQTSEQDERFGHDGVEVVCDPKSYIYLNGTTIDFVDDLMESGFRFSNPNASSTCGCGSSFAV